MERQPALGPTLVLGELAIVAGIAEYGMAVVREVDTNLIASPGFEPHLYDGRVRQFLARLIVSDREFPFSRYAGGKLIQIIARHQIRTERPLGRLQMPRHNADIHPLGLALFELFLQLGKNLGCLGEHQQPAHSAVESVDDKCLAFVPRAFQIKREPIFERVAFAMIGRHGQHVRAFVDHEQVFVFKHDLESAVGPFPFLFGITLQRIVPHLDLVPNSHELATLVARPTIDRNAAMIKQPTHFAVRELGQRLHNRTDAAGLVGGDLGGEGGEPFAIHPPAPFLASL